ncbi:MAG: hypothetical protein JOZ43_05565, partial [Acidobacteriales bacterium]|nr:hypothetical protein [Terriglobales bacterium]
QYQPRLQVKDRQEKARDDEAHRVRYSQAASEDRNNGTREQYDLEFDDLGGFHRLGDDNPPIEGAGTMLVAVFAGQSL